EEAFRFNWVGPAQFTKSSDGQTITITQNAGGPVPPIMPPPAPPTIVVTIKLDAAKANADVTVRVEGRSETIAGFFVAKMENGMPVLYTRGVELGPDEFWIALRDAQPGDWPPQRANGQPFIDPDLLTPKDLPDSAIGQSARDLWAARQTEVAQLNAALRAA